MSGSESTVVRLPNRQRAREEASLWLARLDRGIDESERRELDRWLQEDRQNTDALLQLAAFWDQTAVLSELADLFPLARPKRTRRRTLAWTAALASALGAIAFVLYGIGFEGAVVSEGRHVYETAVGGQSTVELLDGSVVTLNTNSAIEVRYSDRDRTILLRRGEGYFSVEPDPERPFRVHAGGRAFEAVGTAFNVRIGFGDDVAMMVTEGRVGVFPGGGDTPSASAARTDAIDAEAIVDAGSLAIVDAGGVAIQALDTAQMEARLSWQQGMLMFDGDPLEAVLREMGRYTSAQIVVDDSVRDERVGGYFRAGDIDGLLIALRENFDIESTRTGDGRIILSASPAPE